MTENHLQLTTSQSASLIDVHESSVKRWCNDGVLPCSYTDGGHRRIALPALLAFAQSQELSCPLLGLAPWEEQVWHALVQAQDKEDYDALIALTYQWMHDNESDLPARLFRLCFERGLSLSTLFDSIMAPVMHRLGDVWYTGQLAVGDVYLMTHIMIDTLHTLRLFLQKRNKYNRTGPVALVGGAEKNQHEMGALMVRTLLDEAGWCTYYLGTDVPTEELALQQAKHHAQLVCISMMPPRAPADAQRLIRILAHLYKEQYPYRLILGGLDRETPLTMTARLPFQEVQMFSTMEGFNEWMQTSFPLIPNHSSASL